MRTSLLTIAFLIGATTAAVADTELVVLGPAAADPSVPAKRIADVKQVLDKAAVAPMASAPIDTRCVSDIACLAEAGLKAGATRQAVVVSVGVSSKAGVTIELVLVDLAGKELLARRPVTIPDAKLAKELGPALKKFLTDVPVERAKALFAEGNEHYALGEFAPALALYKSAYRAKPLPAFLFNIAQCHRKLDQYQDAIAMYQSYLVGIPDAKNKALVESLIAESRGKLAEVQQAADARRAEDAKREAEQLAVERKKSEDARQAKEAEARAAVEQARIAAERDRERERLFNKHPARKWALLTGGLGVGATIAGGVFGMQTRNAQSRFDAAGCGDPSRLLSEAAVATCNDDRDLGTRRALLTNIFVGGGGALLVAAVFVFAFDPGNVERPAALRPQVAISPSSIQVMVHW